MPTAIITLIPSGQCTVTAPAAVVGASPSATAANRPGRWLVACACRRHQLENVASDNPVARQYSVAVWPLLAKAASKRVFCSVLHRRRQGLGEIGAAGVTTSQLNGYAEATCSFGKRA